MGNKSKKSPVKGGRIDVFFIREGVIHLQQVSTLSTGLSPVVTGLFLQLFEQPRDRQTA